MRRLFIASICLGLFSSPSFGGLVQWFDDLPSSYTPGEPVAFEVRLPAMDTLRIYSIDLVLESSTGIAGVDYFFDATSTMPAASAYLFPSTVFFHASVNVESHMRHRITLSDFDIAGADIVPGINDRVAHVVFRTSPTFSETLSLSIDDASLILNRTLLSPVAGFEAIQQQIADAGAVEIGVVPEPSSLALLLLGGVFFAGRISPVRGRE